MSVHNDIFTSSGLPVGTGMLVEMNNTQSTPLQPSSLVSLQGEVTYFKDGVGRLSRVQERSLGCAEEPLRCHESLRE